MKLAEEKEAWQFKIEVKLSKEMKEALDRATKSLKLLSNQETIRYLLSTALMTLPQLFKETER